jgi:hypothetical protein
VRARTYESGRGPSVPLNAIATRELVGERAGGERFNVAVRIGEPYQVNDVSWACPAAVDGVDRQLADMHGIDSWQALLARGTLA